MKQEVELQLILASRDGDRTAYAEVVRHYSPVVVALLRRMGLDRETAEDLAQDSFLRAFRKIRLYRPERGPFSTWLLALVRNLFRDHHQREKTRRRVLRLVEAGRPSGRPAGQYHQVAQQEAMQALERELAALPEGLRFAFLLRSTEGLPYSEIARVLGVRTGTAKSRVHRARRRLLEGLGPHLEGRERVAPERRRRLSAGGEGEDDWKGGAR